MYNSYQIPGSFDSSMNSSFNNSLRRPIGGTMGSPVGGFSNNRLVGGGFLGPFLLGGLAGGLVSPYFYGRPYYNNYYYYNPYPYYRPY